VLSATGGRLTVSSGTYEVPVQVVGRAAAFPGMTSTRPLLVADGAGLAAALAAVDRDADLVLEQEIWARGEAQPTLLALAAAGLGEVDPERVRTAEEFAARPALRAQTWALGYLRSVALGAGLLGLVGLALHAAAQQRRRTVAAVLLARMGLSRGAGRAATSVELGLVALASALLGTVFALPASRLVLRRLDPVPALPPDPLFAAPVPTILGLLAAVVVTTVVGSVLVDRLTRRSPGGEVLRDGG